jgi:hypothetical protein
MNFKMGQSYAIGNIFKMGQYGLFPYYEQFCTWVLTILVLYIMPWAYILYVHAKNREIM